MIERWAALLGNLIGEDRVRLAGATDSELRPHSPPILVISPMDEEQLRKTVETAAKERIPLVPVGGNTEPRLATHVEQGTVLLSTGDLGGVVEHQVEDLVATFRAGTTLADAQAAVGHHHQQLSLSASYPERATLGGIIAAAAEGPTLHSFGPVRDQVLGIRIVHGDGRLTKAGGRVVKNVTGYDLLRLYTGSRGVLGVITEMTLRLKPLEEARRTLALRFESAAQAWSAGWSMRNQTHGTFALHVLGGSLPLFAGTVAEGGAALIVSLRGNRALIDSLVAECLACSHEQQEVIENADIMWACLQTPFPFEFARAMVATRPSEGRSLLDSVVTVAGTSCGFVHDVNAGRTHIGRPDAEGFSDALWNWKPDHVDVLSDPCFHARRRSRVSALNPALTRTTRELMVALDPMGILNPDRFEIAR